MSAPSSPSAAATLASPRAPLPPAVRSLMVDDVPVVRALADAEFMTLVRRGDTAVHAWLARRKRSTELVTLAIARRTGDGALPREQAALADVAADALVADLTGVLADFDDELVAVVLGCLNEEPGAFEGVRGHAFRRVFARMCLAVWPKVVHEITSGLHVIDRLLAHVGALSACFCAAVAAGLFAVTPVVDYIVRNDVVPQLVALVCPVAREPSTSSGAPLLSIEDDPCLCAQAGALDVVAAVLAAYASSLAVTPSMVVLQLVASETFDAIATSLETLVPSPDDAAPDTRGDTASANTCAVRVDDEPNIQAAPVRAAVTASSAGTLSRHVRCVLELFKRLLQFLYACKAEPYLVLPLALSSRRWSVLALPSPLPTMLGSPPYHLTTLVRVTPRLTRVLAASPSLVAQERTRKEDGLGLDAVLALELVLLGIAFGDARVLDSLAETALVDVVLELATRHPLASAVHNAAVSLVAHAVLPVANDDVSARSQSVGSSLQGLLQRTSASASPAPAVAPSLLASDLVTRTRVHEWVVVQVVTHADFNFRALSPCVGYLEHVREIANVLDNCAPLRPLLERSAAWSLFADVVLGEWNRQAEQRILSPGPRPVTGTGPAPPPKTPRVLRGVSREPLAMTAELWAMLDSTLESAAADSAECSARGSANARELAAVPGEPWSHTARERSASPIVVPETASPAVRRRVMSIAIPAGRGAAEPEASHADTPRPLNGVDARAFAFDEASPSKALCADAAASSGIDGSVPWTALSLVVGVAAMGLVAWSLVRSNRRPFGK